MGEWRLEKRSDDLWVVTGYRPDRSKWARLASDVEVELWHRWHDAEERIAAVKERLEVVGS